MTLPGRNNTEILGHDGKQTCVLHKIDIWTDDTSCHRYFVLADSARTLEESLSRPATGGPTKDMKDILAAIEDPAVWCLLEKSARFEAEDEFVNALPIVVDGGKYVPSPMRENKDTKSAARKPDGVNWIGTVSLLSEFDSRIDWLANEVYKIKARLDEIGGSNDDI